MIKKLLMLTVGSIGIAVFTISLIKLNAYYLKKKKEKLMISDLEKKDCEESSQGQSVVQQLFDQQFAERTTYESSVTQPSPYKNLLKKPQLNDKITHLHYYVLLSLSKSRGYEGVIKINITSKQQDLNTTDLFIDFVGGAISYLAVNHKRIEEENVDFKQHRILIRKQWLVKNQNTVQIIFCNKYAFMGDGLTCYFPLDEGHKYSLKGQVIYVRNGFHKIAKIFPCLNVLNPCQVDLELLYPKLFIAESNTNKIEMKLACHNDYPVYQFLFSVNRILSSSTRLNNSNLSDTASCVTGMNGQFRQKGLSRFATAKLSSIHDFFFVCSAISEIRPQVNFTSQTASMVSSSKALKDVIIRYYTKQHLAKRALSFLSSLQTQIIEIFRKINQYKKKNKISLKYQCKVDIFFVDDLSAEGDFFSGAILLNEKTIERAVIDRRLYYLLARAFVGIGILMKKKQNLLTLSQIMKLNQLTLEIFGQCCDYIYVKNKQYENIRDEGVRLIKNWEQKKYINKLINSQEQKQHDMEYWLTVYHEKQCRYFIKDLEKIVPKVSSNVTNILNYLDPMNCDQYWTFFMARYPLIQVNVSQILIKISLKYKGVPKNETDLNFAKTYFIKSKYYLKFFTYREIENDLPRFLKLESYGIQKILPYIKIKEVALEQIPLKFQSHLNIKENKEQCRKLYENFKKYNQTNNFHHVSALRSQIIRINLLARNYIKSQRRNIECCLQTWKLLQKLKIYPEDRETFELVMSLQKIKKGLGENLGKQRQERERAMRDSGQQDYRRQGVDDAYDR